VGLITKPYVRGQVPLLRPDQRTIANNNARFKVVACGRRWGKTTLGMAMAVQFAFAMNRKVWWVAPTYGMSFEPWRILKEALVDVEGSEKLEAQRFIALPEGGSIQVKTADNPDRLRGTGLDFVVIDEAAYIPEYLWESVLRPALVDRSGKALIISTPRARNWFHRVYQYGQDPEREEWFSWQAPTSDNKMISREELLDVKLTLSERLYQQEYEAKFLDDGGTVFRNVQDSILKKRLRPNHLNPTSATSWVWIGAGMKTSRCWQCWR